VRLIKTIPGFAPAGGLRPSKIVPDNFVESVPGHQTLLFLEQTQNFHSFVCHGPAVRLIKTIPGFAPAGGLRPSKIVPDNFVESVPGHQTSFPFQPIYISTPARHAV
jgi:hypothetical protein